jgi:hypothetical protein
VRGGKTSPRDGAEATPEQTNPVRTAGPVRGREKPKEIIVGFFNQADAMHVYFGPTTRPSGGRTSPYRNGATVSLDFKAMLID